MDGIETSESMPSVADIDLSAARAALAQETERRRQACVAAINAALKQMRCHIDVVETRVNGRVVQCGWHVVAEALE